MSFTFEKATRHKALLRMALSGPSGSGKSYSALLIAQGLGGPIAAIDTERGSIRLYSHLVDFDVLELGPPFSPERFIEAITAAEKHLGPGGTLIIDSTTHEWKGQGGVLEIVDMLTRANSKGNSFSAWDAATPRHQKFIDKIIQSNCHIIATMRAKAAYVQSQVGGKTKIEKVGTAPEQRDGFEFEFTAVLDLSNDQNVASASKDRTGLFRDPQIITVDTGKRLLTWLNQGGEGPKVAAPAPEPAANDERHAIPPKSAEPARATTAAADPAPPRDARKVANDRLWKIAGDAGNAQGLGRQNIIDAVHQVAEEKFGDPSTKPLNPDQLTELGDHFEQDGNLLAAHHRFVGKQAVGDDEIPNFDDPVPPAAAVNETAGSVNTTTGEVTPPIDDVELWLAICDAMPDAGDTERLDTLNAMAIGRFGGTGFAGLTQAGRDTLTKAIKTKPGEMMALAQATASKAVAS